MNNAFLGAYRKGLRAGREDGPNVSPYDEHDMCRGGPTWARAFHRYWQKGYDDGQAGCDCQNPCHDERERCEAVWHYSEECPVHNLYPDVAESSPTKQPEPSGS
jgi:hypothetical protein